MNQYERPQRSLVERGFINVCKATTVVAGGLALGAILSSALDPTETEIRYDGESTLVHIGDQVSVPIVRDVAVYAGGDAKHDIAWYAGAADSNAANRGLFLQNIEYVPDGMLELQAYEDDQLGFYVLMSEFDGQVSEEFDYSSVMVTTRQPLSCDFNLDTESDGDNYLTPQQQCLDFMNNDPDGWHGIEHSSFSKGGVFGTRLDNTPPTQARRMTDTMLDNDWCQIGLRFGLDEELFFWSDAEQRYKVVGPSDIPETAVYEGLRNRIIAMYRKIAADTTGLPYTHANGRPIFLTPSMRDYLLDLSAREGAVKDMTAQEFRYAVEIDQVLGGNSDHEIKEFAVDRPVAEDLIELKQEHPDIVIDEVTDNKDWTKEDQQLQYALNYNCVPLTEQGMAEFKEEAALTNKIASYTGMVPGALLVRDPSSEPIESTLDRIYVNPGARNFFVDYVQEILSPDEVTERIILYKQKHDIPLTQPEIDYVIALRDVQSSPQPSETP